MKPSSSMSFFCVLSLFLVCGSAEDCYKDYVKTVNAWSSCILKRDCLKKGFVIYNGYCRRTCPRALYLSYGDRTCYRSCPDDMVVNGSNCLNATQCTAKDMFVYNGSCVDSCPLGTVVTMSDVCVHNCPHQTITNTTHCIHPHKCTEGGKVIFNNTCTGKCPPGFPYVDSGRCASDCRGGKVSNNHQCITEHRCIYEEGKVIQNRSCVGSCSPDAPNIYEGQCHSECPPGTVLNASLSTCLAESVCSEKGQFVHNKTCIAECPRYVSGKVCVDECPRQTVLYHKECITITKCTHFNYLYMYVFNGTCVESCPEEAPYIDGKSCFAVCPLDKVADDKLCVFKYQCKPKVIYNNTCLTSCPETAPLSAPGAQGATYCVSACPVSTVKQNISCINSNRCLLQGKFIFNGTCLATCPEAAPYIRDGSCHHTCPSRTVKQNYTCFSNDWCTSKGNFVYRGLCISTCPKEATFHSGSICHHQCPPGQRAAGTECIECDSRKLLDGKECIYEFECKERNKFQYEGKCLSSCPQGTKKDVVRYIPTCLAQPNLALLLTLLITALLVCTGICLCMTIPRNGERTLDERLKAILTINTRKQLYENHGFEEHEIDKSGDTNDVETTAIIKETDQINQSEI